MIYSTNRSVEDCKKLSPFLVGFYFFVIVYNTSRNLLGNKSLRTSLIISLREIVINGIATSKGMDILQPLIHINSHYPHRAKEVPLHSAFANSKHCDFLKAWLR